MTKKRRRQSPRPAPSQLEPCTGCGNSNPLYLGECPRCGSQKCDCCDLEGDVECGNCGAANDLDFNDYDDEDDGGPW